MANEGKPVLVTGGSGYIGGELIRQLLAKGWTVHTTVRNLKKEQGLRAAIGDSGGRLKVFKAELMDDAGWAEATAGCSHVAHVASPFPVGVPRNEDELIVPAREGALRALRFAREAGVTRFVMTSSAAAIAYGHAPGKTEFTEADWTNVDAAGVQPYVKSKTIAERAAREWVAREGGGMAFCTVNPVLVLGPVASADLAASVEIPKRLLEGSIPALPDVGFSVVDVRDVAELHVLVLEAPEDKVSGGRFIAAAGPFYKMADVARVLRERLGDKARKVPARRMPDLLVRLFAMVSPDIRQLTGELGRVRSTSGQHARDVLGWSPRDPDQTIEDTARSLIERGLVKV
ncbi:MAG TPA: aldehyde reductase [Novosphingobium sp.]|nr:aldehyde reductase [Novosphingobium sp.]